MDKISRQELFSAIHSSTILAPYLERDPHLAKLLADADHPDIHYFETPSPAREIALSLKRRLDGMVAKNITHNLESTKQLVAFMEEHPDALIHNVTFNSHARHYGVRCARVDGQIHVICVMIGGRIPDTILGDSAP